MISATNPHSPAPSAAQLVASRGGRYSKTLGIDLGSGTSEEVFKWLLAAILFGARISKTLAVRTFHEFIRAGLMTPQEVLDRGWDGLVAILDRGGYVRYDFKTASKLLDVAGHLMDHYRGDLNALHRAAADEADLEHRIQALGKGIGEVTVNIFLREMRGIWDKADPSPCALVLAAARNGGFIPADTVDQRKALNLLMSIWQGEGKRAGDFPDFEAALLRLGLAERRRAAKKHGPRNMVRE